MVLHTAAGATARNGFEATFSESNESITNRIADLGVFQLINTGSGAIECLGAATVVVGSTQDRSVHPCGARSWANAEVRRIVLSAGVLVVREESMACCTGSGIVISGTYEVDGAASTGTFAGACGEGDIVVTPASGSSHLSGKLKLAGPA